MLYDKKTGTLTRVVAPGETPEVAELEGLARQLGGNTVDGKPILGIAFVHTFGNPEDLLPHYRRLGIECRVIEGGAETVVVPGRRIGLAADAGEGTLLPVLRERSWPGASAAMCRPLVCGAVDGGPWVSFGIDLPRTLVVLKAGDRGGAIQDVELEASTNLARLPLDLQPAKGGLVLVDGEYAAEAVLLLPEVAGRLRKTLSAGLLVVAAPLAGACIVAAMDDMAKAAALTALCTDKFASGSGRRISPTPFLVDGGVVGFVSTETDSGAPARKPWWRFW